MRINSKVLIIAGSDSSGGAGIQADIKTVSSLGSYAMTAITAVTSQNTTGVLSVFSISPKEISKQIEFTSKDIRPDAIEIGMLGNAKVINAVIKSLSKIKVNKIILDPVMVAKGGTRLIDNNSIQILKEKLLKRVSLITPNIPEAEILVNQKIISKDDMIILSKAYNYVKKQLSNINTEKTLASKIVGGNGIYCSILWSSRGNTDVYGGYIKLDKA